jgi:hypothetical protein
MMTCVDFPQANKTIARPPSLSEDQCFDARAFVHDIEGGSCNGVLQVVVAWKPDAEDIARLAAGGLIYIGMLGGLSAHSVATDFRDITNPE